MKKRIETKIKIIGNISSRTEERQYYLKQLQLSQRVFNEIHMKISRLSTVEEVFKQTYGESLQSSSTAKRLKKKYVNCNSITHHQTSQKLQKPLQNTVLCNHHTLSIGTERLACLNNPRGVQLGTLA